MNTGKLVAKLRKQFSQAFYVNDQVSHPAYGPGTVTYVYSDELVEVTFGNAIVIPMRTRELVKNEPLQS